MLRRLRPLLVSVWNRAIHGGRAIVRRVGAVARGRIDRCACCGQRALMLRRPEYIPARLIELWGLSPRATAALIRKESLECSRCGAKLRARRLAEVVLEIFPCVPPSPSLADWAARPESRLLRVAEINRIDGVHQALAPLPGLASSDFGAPGDGGVPSEDLMSLTYPDATFDLVLTSETLEHVPDLARALGEIRRVLRPGGRHVFTIPVHPGVPATFPRTTATADGVLVDHAPPIYHPGGDSGYRVFTEFGLDAGRVVEAAGFDVEVRFGPTTEDDLAQVYVARKRETGAGG